MSRAESVLQLATLDDTEAVFRQHEGWELAVTREDWEELDRPAAVTVAVWPGDQGIRREVMSTGTLRKRLAP